MSERADSGASAGGAATLTFRGGGWVILLAGLLVLAVLVWSLLGPLLGRRPVGDGRTLASYGFDLSNLTVATETLVPSGNPRGFLPSLDRPKHLEGRDMAVFNERNRPKYVVTSDRVAGIVVNGQPHAWPLSLLNVHEVVNDEVGGVPVAATYSPLCDSLVVFDRRVGGVARLFEVSGLLVDSNLVFYDKHVEAGQLDGVEPGSGNPHVPSLFLQLERRAIAGPLAAGGGTELDVLPGACITTWADWLATHPTTTVAERDPDMVRRMKEISYARYFLTPRLEFPADPMPDEASMAERGLRLKSPILAIRGESGWNLVPIEPLAAAAGPDRTARIDIDGAELRVHLPTGPAAARAERVDGAPLEVIPCLYFSAEAVLQSGELAERAPSEDK